MDARHFIWIGMLIGSVIGGWIPTIWGDSSFSVSSVMGGVVGGLIGIYVGAKIASW